ncbi:TPM domain-containing protein [Nitrosomonas ureae]|nr:YgcG family protein [Nitrosomonas ureae]
MAIPSLKAHVTDLTGTLSAHETAQLEHQLAAFEKAKGSQIAILIVPTTQPYAIEQYSMQVVETRKIGRKDINDGVLLLIAKNDRMLRIEVGYGLEGTLPDATAKRIISEIITPRFKQGRFAEGIQAGIEAIIGLINGETLPLPSNTHNNISPSTYPNIENLIVILIFSTVIGRILQVHLGRIVGAGVTGIGLGFVGWSLFSSVAIAILIAAIVFILNLFIHINPGIYRTGRGNWSNSGFRGGGSGGGGFSGGGGSFGGGGASGRW